MTKGCLDAVSVVGGPAIHYNYGDAAAQFSQVTGGLAALAFAAVVFSLQGAEPRTPRRGDRGVLLLPVIFVVSMLAAYQYGVASADLVCERRSVISVLAALNFAFAVMAISAWMSAVWHTSDDHPSEVQRMSEGLYWVVVLAAASGVSLASSDLLAEFGLTPTIPSQEYVLGLGAFLLSASISAAARVDRLQTFLYDHTKWRGRVAAVWISLSVSFIAVWIFFQIGRASSEELQALQSLVAWAPAGCAFAVGLIGGLLGTISGRSPRN